METYYSVNEIQNSKCSKFMKCMISCLIFLIGLIIGNNVYMQECKCINNSSLTE